MPTSQYSMKLITSGIWARRNQHRVHCNNKLQTPASRKILQHTHKRLWLCSNLLGKLGSAVLRFCHLYPFSNTETRALVFGGISFLLSLPVFPLIFRPTAAVPGVWGASPRQRGQRLRHAVGPVGRSPSKQCLEQHRPQDPSLAVQVPEKHKLWNFSFCPSHRDMTSTKPDNGRDCRPCWPCSCISLPPGRSPPHVHSSSPTQAPGGLSSHTRLLHWPQTQAAFPHLCSYSHISSTQMPFPWKAPPSKVLSSRSRPKAISSMKPSWLHNQNYSLCLLFPHGFLPSTASSVPIPHPSQNKLCWTGLDLPHHMYPSLQHFLKYFQRK